MKTRNGFVSNSSSSSFICTVEDLEKIDVYGDVSYCSVKQYVEHYWKRELFGPWGSPALAKVKFVPDNEFADRYVSDRGWTLPNAAAGAYEEYRSAYVAAKKLTDCGAPAEERTAAWHKAEQLEQSVADAIWTALEPKWKDVVLAEVNSSDDNGDEESMYGSFGSLHDPAFYRTFNNH